MIPYAVDAPFDRRPVVNWLVLGVLVSVFSAQVLTEEKKVKEASINVIESPVDVLEVPSARVKEVKRELEDEEVVTGPMRRFVLDGWEIRGLLAHSWLQANIVFLVGSLVFLWPFGNAVCSKLGNVYYLAVYLVFGLLGGMMHLRFGGGTAVGSAAVISGIVGMYIAFFPENLISCFFLVPHPVTFGISGYWVVLLWFVFDIVASVLSGQNVTCYAHIGCFGVGLGLAVLMLRQKWVVMGKGEKSLLQMFEKRKEEQESEKKEEGKGQAERAPSKESEPGQTRWEIIEPVKQTAKEAAPKAEKPKEEFVRFRCQCGHRLKVRTEHAGKKGRCPKCSGSFKVPMR
ncbi:MAG: rhomboid family intramembrane serine protease [Planctomycetota bacterium]